MGKVYFENIASKISQQLNMAKNEVRVAMAWFTNGELFRSLIDCLNREVKVDLILLDNPTNFMDYAPDFNEFINAGGTLRIAGANIGFMHHKFCVIDDKTVITGSYNWTYSAENRNIENIITSDNKETIALYKSEYTRLSSAISPSSRAPRLTWDQIETRTDVDFNELNYEIQKISEVQSRPIRKVFETQTKIIKTDIKLKPFAKKNIGVLALDEHDCEVFKVFIKAGVKLPYKSDSIELYFDSKNQKSFPINIIYGDINDKSNWHLLKEDDLMNIVLNTSDENLPIQFAMSLDDNGSLRIDIVCAKSGKKLTISTLNSSLVKYE